MNKHQRGTRSLAVQEKMDLILSWVKVHVSALSTVHIPSVEYCQADFLSEKLCWIRKTPDVDLLASRFSAKWDGFLSRTRDPQSFVMNALVTLWDLVSIMNAFLQLLPCLFHSIWVEGISAIPVTLVPPRRLCSFNVINLLVGKSWTLLV